MCPACLMNHTIKDATVKRLHYESQDQPRTQLADFLAAYSFARRLKTLNGLTLYEFIRKIWASRSDRFILDPIHQMPGLNSAPRRSTTEARRCYLHPELCGLWSRRSTD